MTLQRNSDNHILSHLAGTAAGILVLARTVIINDLGWYTPHYTSSISNQKLKLEHIISKTATEASYTKRSSYMKDVTTDKTWSFQLGVGNGKDVPVYIVVGFMHREQCNQQHRNNDTFFRPSVVNAPANIGSEKFADAGTNCKYAIDR